MNTRVPSSHPQYSIMALFHFYFTILSHIHTHIQYTPYLYTRTFSFSFFFFFLVVFSAYTLIFFSFLLLFSFPFFPFFFLFSLIPHTLYLIVLSHSLSLSHTLSLTHILSYIHISDNLYTHLDSISIKLNRVFLEFSFRFFPPYNQFPFKSMLYRIVHLCVCVCVCGLWILDVFMDVSTDEFY